MQSRLRMARALVAESRGKGGKFVSYDASPPIDETDDPVAYVLSLNLHRRHLTPSQCGLVAARAEEIYAKAAHERQRGGQGGKLLPANLQEGTALKQAAKAVGVSGRTDTCSYGRRPFSGSLRPTVPESVLNSA